MIIWFVNDIIVNINYRNWAEINDALNANEIVDLFENTDNNKITYIEYDDEFLSLYYSNRDGQCVTKEICINDGIHYYDNLDAIVIRENIFADKSEYKIRLDVPYKYYSEKRSGAL